MFGVSLLYDRAVIYRYRFYGFHRCESWCDLEVFPRRDRLRIVIATEVPDNPGTSITNMCEHLVGEVAMDLCIDPTKMVWIEHYGYPDPTDPTRARTYDRVSFTLMPGRNGTRLAEPKWRAMQDQDWLALGLEPRQSEFGEGRRHVR